MNKTALKVISELAGRCPMIMEQVGTEHSHWTGHDLKLAGYASHENLKENELYPVPYPVLRDVDHKNRIKKQYKKHGKEGILEYLVKMSHFNGFMTYHQFIDLNDFIMKTIP